MQPLTLDQLDRESAELDRQVLASAGLDRFCSSSDWVLPAARALMPPREEWLRRGDHGYAAFMRSLHPNMSVLEPLEAMWGLACPLVGANARGLAAELAAECSGGRDVVVICGLERDSPRFTETARALDYVGYTLRLGPVTRRHVASLDGGVEGFLSRRSANFRVGLKRAGRRAGERGISFVPVEVDAATVEPAYARVLAVDAQSWKGREGVGLEASSMAAFYRAMLPRLARRGALRLMFAEHDGRDVAYILGGLLDGTYRGLQFAFIEGYEDCALGNLCQVRQIAALAGEGVRRYDLGTDAEYKQRWGELAHDTVSLIAYPNSV